MLHKLMRSRMPRVIREKFAMKHAIRQRERNRNDGNKADRAPETESAPIGQWIVSNQRHRNGFHAGQRIQIITRQASRLNAGRTCTLGTMPSTYDSLATLRCTAKCSGAVSAGATNRFMLTAGSNESTSRSCCQRLWVRIRLPSQRCYCRTIRTFQSTNTALRSGSRPSAPGKICTRNRACLRR